MPSGSSITMLLMLALLQSMELPAQWRSPRLTRLGPEEGISSTINAMAQDSVGFMYFATIDGLYKYDGHTFRFFGHDPMDDNSIGEGDVNAIHAARDGKVWMTLRFGGLNSYDPHTDLFQRYPVPTLSFRSNPGAHGLYEDQNKILWVGADHFRLLSFDRSTTQFTSYTPSWIDAEKHGGRLMIMSIVGDKQYILLCFRCWVWSSGCPTLPMA
jgi:ligand-binding sensor domain-containing protein